ncbi:undecaprenyl/decaprenyl-phosphate alpha-N-acetylglucosaminyl 1-phosphate transferase [Candidatus Dependentiae bacterium]|nr:undecaprenyl/decaprenyl-phosphate alpha-N-acetylglucosaminyl 1-phosphate transferase [Candidatus Dependentiae bacterium]MCC7415339.1 undecaprenyl/decaprenyl-phosphate alpha-N-acetylglucosaminyl 1-phosphate transferase [Campylobacterota bacterium]
MLVSLLIDACKAGSIAFLLTFFLIPLFCWFSRRYSLVDMPDGVIKKHESPIPNLGGLAVYCGFAVASLSLLHTDAEFARFLLFGSALFLFIGLIDDRVCLTPGQKFFCQSIAALFFLKMGFCFVDQSIPSLMTCVVSFWWIVTVTNAFNLIDIMDGLAATTALGIALSLAIIALYIKAAILVLLVALIGSLFAFLWYNKPPACIYLGDAGALFIGGFLAVCTFLYPWSRHAMSGYLIPLFIFFVPLFELVALIVIRTYKGIPFYLPSPDHFSMYLVRNGWNKKSILWYIGFVSLFIAGVSILFFNQQISLVEFSISALFLVMTWLCFLTIRTV